MHKNTFLLVTTLVFLASLLLGINIGKKLAKKELTISELALVPTSHLLSPTSQFTFPTSLPTSIESSQVSGITSYTDTQCAYSFSYPSSFISSKTETKQANIFADLDNPENYIATTCASQLPKPPLPSSKIEQIELDGIVASLYHDQNPDGSPRDEVIVKHPRNGMEIILAGFGVDFQNALSSFRFIQ